MVTNMSDNGIDKIEETNGEIAKNIIHSYLQSNSNNTVRIVRSDEILAENDRKYVSANNEAFNHLLNDYVQAAGKNLNTKLSLKKAFFIICSIILIGIFLLMIAVTLICIFKNVNTETLVIAIVNNIISFFTAFIVLPKTIAEYLFNPEEEKDTINLIRNIQEHDKDIRKGIHE